MPKISVIVPVYNAEKLLRRCVESIVFGEEQDLEVVLIEDCSKDGSWQLCQKLAQEYPQVRCLHNDRNRGVSYTRNRGLDEATGQYLLFVDSDDWVSGSYARTLITTAEENPGKLVACGFTFIDHTKNEKREYGIDDTRLLPRQQFHRLSAAVMLQQLWNKVFLLEDIRRTGIRFNETISMGEDYQFVMDLIEAMDYQQCVIIPRPLYYYIRWGNGSLMDEWSRHETYADALGRALRVEHLCGPDSARLELFKEGYGYRILREKSLTEKQKRATVYEIYGKDRGSRFYRKQKLLQLREQLWQLKNIMSRSWIRVVGKLRTVMNKCKIRKALRSVRQKDVTVISQNCIGGVLTHDLGQAFRSPTVNLFLPAGDFIRFVLGLEHYLNAELKLIWGEEYPIGILDDIQLHFVHYDTCRQAREAWQRRKQRVDLNRLLVLSTDRDGFEEALFEQWKTIVYPKLLFTACQQYAEHEDVLYFPKYSKLGCVPDLIPKREFYKGDVLLKKINSM